MVFRNGVKNIQAAAYNGARTEYYNLNCTHRFKQYLNYYFDVCVSACKKNQLHNGCTYQKMLVCIQSCHIFRKDKNDFFISFFFWIRSVQNWSISMSAQLEISFAQLGRLPLEHFTKQLKWHEQNNEHIVNLKKKKLRAL